MVYESLSGEDRIRFIPSDKIDARSGIRGPEYCVHWKIIREYNSKFYAWTCATNKNKALSDLHEGISNRPMSKPLFSYSLFDR